MRTLSTGLLLLMVVVACGLSTAMVAAQAPSGSADVRVSDTYLPSGPDGKKHRHGKKHGRKHHT